MKSLRTKKPFLEYSKDDESRTPSPNIPTSYDILASKCSTTASDLRKDARLRRLTANCRMYENIVEYVTNSSPGYAITVANIFRVDRTNEREPFSDKYRIMLWHGTKPNFVSGIIQTGFRMGSGGLFGGGIYFADRIAKSAGYVSKCAQGTAFFILAEVAPGRVYKAHHFHSDYKSAPQGYDSVKGMGKQIPTWKENKHYGGAILPSGKTKLNERHQQYDMNYSEYIVYDPNRIIIRFIVECSF